jgi:hypothetical protein
LDQVLALCPKGDYCHDNAPLELEEEDLILTTEVIYLRAWSTFFFFGLSQNQNFESQIAYHLESGFSHTKKKLQLMTHMCVCMCGKLCGFINYNVQYVI